MTQVGPVGSGGEPLTVLWTWRQRLDEEAEEKQQAQKTGERQQSGERGENPRPGDSIAHEGPVDGPKVGDQGYLARLQARLRDAIGDVPGVVRRLAEVPQQQRTVLHSAIAANPAAAERG